MSLFRKVWRNGEILTTSLWCGNSIFNCVSTVTEFDWKCEDKKGFLVRDQNSFSTGYWRTVFCLVTYYEPAIHLLLSTGRDFLPLSTLYLIGSELRCYINKSLHHLHWAHLVFPSPGECILQYLSSCEKSLICDMSQSTCHDTKSHSRKHIGIVSLARIQGPSIWKSDWIKRTATGKNRTPLQHRHMTNFKKQHNILNKCVITELPHS